MILDYTNHNAMHVTNDDNNNDNDDIIGMIIKIPFHPLSTLLIT